jgi:tRNA pseudouridine55 synthase
MDGLLIIDKPAGVTSHDVVARARKILRERRIGHTGTLDPFATGVLVLLVGRATRLAQFISGVEKEYEAIIRLGYATDTGDTAGTPLTGTDEQRGRQWSDDELNAALGQLSGELQQIPPMYSAKKVGGKKLYELARRGEAVEREPVNIIIHAFERSTPAGPLLKNNHDGTTDFAVRVVCSAGTYVRTLAEDFGKLLGIGAHLAELRRTRAGEFAIKDAITLEQLKEFVDDESLSKILLPPEAALSHLPFVHLSADEAQRARNGMAITLSGNTFADGEKVGMRDEHGVLLGVGTYDEEHQLLHPRVVLSSENRG